jgi:hypothetical protein
MAKQKYSVLQLKQLGSEKSEKNFKKKNIKKWV